MTKETRQRITNLQELARTARYNLMLTEKRLNTAKRKNNLEKIDYEYMVLGAWADTYQCAREDILTYGGA